MRAECGSPPGWRAGAWWPSTSRARRLAVRGLASVLNRWRQVGWLADRGRRAGWPLYRGGERANRLAGERADWPVAVDGPASGLGGHGLTSVRAGGDAALRAGPQDVVVGVAADHYILCVASS